MPPWKAMQLRMRSERKLDFFVCLAMVIVGTLISYAVYLEFGLWGVVAMSLGCCIVTPFLEKLFA